MMRRALIWLLRILAVAILLAALAYFFRAPLLTGLAKAWMVNNPPVKADAIVLLGGGLDTRPAIAARLYQGGWAPRILVMQVAPSPAVERGLVPSEGDVTRRLLESEGVPARAIQMLLPAVTSTFEESLVAAAWARTNQARCLLVTTDIFHTRRAAWIFKHEMKSSGMDIRTIGVQPRHYTVTNWWQTEQGLTDFQSELLKYAYYRYKY